MISEAKMNPFYMPLLRAKKGEFDALSHLSKSTKRFTVPLMDIPLPKDKNVILHLDDVASDLGKAWGKREIFFDMSHWPDNAKTDEGEHVLLATWKKLENNNVIAHPVIGFDRWDSPEYVQAIKNILDMSDLRICLRLDEDAIRDIGLMDEVIDSIHDQLNLQSQSTFALLDLEDMASIAIDEIAPKVVDAINFLHSRGFSNIILAGSSMPSSVTFIPQENSSKLVTRKELILWKMILPEVKSVRLWFGDYGVRNPRSSDNVINPHINGKIRYTIPNQYIVVRGHSMQKPPKGKQYYSLAKIVISSPHYLGASFSWGDQRILDCSNEVFMGNSTSWIGIDTNHHIEYVLAELNEFVKIPTKAKKVNT
jgi:hypothetical protein